MDPPDHISPEIRARTEANALFLALHRGELAKAAQAQERLRRLGWNLTREHPQPQERGRSRDE
jgi:hypothetical protein